MERVNVLVIGAGAVGLAIAYELSKEYSDVVVVEKEISFGKHTSSRNSEVIHAGLYYETGSLKASLCVSGNELLYQYLKDNDISHKNTGKIIVATQPEEEQVLAKYFEMGIKNGCPQFKLLSQEEVYALEPKAKCISGLLIPSTGIFDTHSYMKSLERNAEKQGAYSVYGMEVCSINMVEEGYRVEFTNGEEYLCKQVINSAGLWSDKIAQLAGLNIEKLGIKMHWCKGEYYKTTKIKGINHLIYPVADPKGIFLGIHLTINLNNEVRFGPNAYYIDEIDYRFDEDYFADFYSSINRYLDVSKEDLMPDDTGVRPKLQGPNDGFRDFYIKEETKNGLPNFVNLIGIESPGLTASLAIAGYVKELLNK